MKVACALAAALAALSFPFGSASQAQGIHMQAVLIGGNEVGSGGDPDGYGTVAINFRGNTELCVAILVSKIATPTAAHIHEAFAPSNGPVIINLPVPAAGDPGFSSGCVAITGTQYSLLRANPQKFYVNVHNAAFPGGALRGQLR